MNNAERIERAARVRRWLEGDEWTGAWSAVREAYIHVIENGTDEQALDARRMLRAANQARAHLEQFIADGAIVAADIAARRSLMKL